MKTVELSTRSLVVKTISDEDVAILIQIRDNIRNNYFLIGDIANKYIYNAVMSNYAVNSQDIYDQVGKIVGKSGRTVRYYAEEAAFYTQEMRNDYDILPFSFFVFARTMGDEWNIVLDTAMEHPGYSLDGIKRLFLPSFDSSDTIDETRSDSIRPEKAVDQDKALNVGPLINTMISLSTMAINLVNSAPLSDENKTKLLDAAMTIRYIISSIAKNG